MENNQTVDKDKAESQVGGKDLLDVPSHYKWLNRPTSHSDVLDFQLALLEATPTSIEFPDSIPDSERSKWIKLLKKNVLNAFKCMLENPGTDLIQLEDIKNKIIISLDAMYSRKLVEESYCSKSIYSLLVVQSLDVVTPLDIASRSGEGSLQVLESFNSDSRRPYIPAEALSWMFNYLGGEVGKLNLIALYLLTNFDEIEEIFRRYDKMNRQNSDVEAENKTFQAINIPISELRQKPLCYWHLAFYELRKRESLLFESEQDLKEQLKQFIRKDILLEKELLFSLVVDDRQYALNWVDFVRERIEFAYKNCDVATLAELIDFGFDDISGSFDSFPLRSTYVDTLVRSLIKVPLSFLKQPSDRNLVLGSCKTLKTEVNVLPSIPDSLSEQERRIFIHLKNFPNQYLNYGKRDGIDGIAEVLNLTEKTVRNYVALIIKKWGSGCPVKTGKCSVAFCPEK